MRLRPVAIAALVLFSVAASAQAPHIFQRPALSRTAICFGYAGDLWTVAREGGRATRLTTGVGIETSPVFSPDGLTIAFAGDYDGNVDVFTIPVTGGIPHRVTYHPGADYPVAWTPDGRGIVIRATRNSASRYAQLYTVPAAGGVATLLPLPLAYTGTMSADGSRIAYSPLAPAFGSDYTNFTAWGNYRGGRAGTIRITTLPGLDSVDVPHEVASDFSPAWIGQSVFFLSGRDGGHIGVFKYDQGTKAVAEVVKPHGPQIRSLAGDGQTLIYDQLGELYLLDPATGKSHLVNISVDADLPEVRPSIKNVAGEIDHIAISPTGVRAVVEAHGEILTVAAKKGPTRNLTNTPGVMERAPAWSPDGQSIAYFSDASGLYTLKVAPQTGGPAKTYALAPEPAYYFDPKWAPDSKHILFHDNRTNIYMLDLVSGKLVVLGDKNTFGGFSDLSYDSAWSPDSKWIAYPRSMPNHLHAIFLYSLDTGASTQVTSQLADARSPAFDRDGKFLYFVASTNAGATSDGLDMTSDLYEVTGDIYAAVLSSAQASPVAPELEDEKAKTPDGSDEAKGSDEKKPAKGAMPPKPVRIDLAGIDQRIVPLPLPLGVYSSLQTGLKGSVYFLEKPRSGRFGENESVLNRWTIEDRKTERLAERVYMYQLSADGEKMLLELSSRSPDRPGPGGPPSRVIVPSTAPIKPGDGTLSFADLQVHVDPHAEWTQMFHEVWRIERAYFYDPNFHGTDTVADERRLAPYAAAVASRADLNYLFQEMLTPFSVGHLRGSGGAIPEARKLPGGLLGADYVVTNNRYCLAKIYAGGQFNPEIKAPLAQPGLNVHVGDCILAINGQDLTAATDIQQPLEGTAGKVILLHLASPDGSNARDINVVPLSTESALRNIDWIDANQRKVDQLSGGKLAYVYLPDTGAGGFTAFNRMYMSQLDKQGAIIDERFNGGGQIADYIIEVMMRRIESYWSPRYGAIEHTPNAGIYGPKVMIVNEFAGSGGDAMPWLFKHNQVGPLVGKRTWGGLVGIGDIPVLMDGGAVTSPSVAFFSPKGEWDVENHGVDPDVVVDQDPKAVAEGHDPQLEKAVALAMEQMAAHPEPQVKRPPYPVYH